MSFVQLSVIPLSCSRSKLVFMHLQPFSPCLTAEPAPSANIRFAKNSPLPAQQPHAIPAVALASRQGIPFPPGVDHGERLPPYRSVPAGRGMKP